VPDFARSESSLCFLFVAPALWLLSLCARSLDHVFCDKNATALNLGIFDLSFTNATQVAQATSPEPASVRMSTRPPSGNDTHCTIRIA
jgi:hypothetical protein